MSRPRALLILLTVTAILLLNDFFLKAFFHNAVTGKLSDLAWLFLFPFFFSSLFPSVRKWIFLFTAAGFLFWKTPLSDSLLEWIHSFAGGNFGRTIDYSDLFALLALPFSFRFSENFFIQKNTFRFAPVLNGLCFSVLFLSVLSCEAPDMTDPEERKLTADYYYNFNQDTKTLSIARKISENSELIVIGPHVAAYGWDKNFIIAQTNPVPEDTIAHQSIIDTDHTEYAILCVPTAKRAEKIYDHLSEKDFLEKRQTLGVSDTLVFTR